MYFAFWGWASWGMDPLVSLPICRRIALLLGIATYRGIIKRIINAPPLAQIVTTFGLVVLLSLAQMLWSADYRTVENPLLGGRSVWRHVCSRQPSWGQPSGPA